MRKRRWSSLAKTTNLYLICELLELKSKMEIHGNSLNDGQLSFICRNLAMFIFGSPRRCLFYVYFRISLIACHHQLVLPAPEQKLGCCQRQISVLIAARNEAGGKIGRKIEETLPRTNPAENLELWSLLTPHGSTLIQS